MPVASSKLVVLLDGRPLPDEQARAIWTRFSAHMDQHQGDTAGFAQIEGFSSVRPESRAGRAVLVIATRN